MGLRSLSRRLNTRLDDNRITSVLRKSPKVESVSHRTVKINRLAAQTKMAKGTKRAKFPVGYGYGFLKKTDPKDVLRSEAAKTD